MGRRFKHILFLLILSGANLAYTALVQANSAGEPVERLKVEYKSAQLRDPFQPYLGAKLATQGQPESNLTQPKISPDTFVVQGIIWGGRIPQAIINAKVLAEGDLIEGAKILKIDKSGITLNVAGEVVNLSAPGKGYVSKKTE